MEAEKKPKNGAVKANGDVIRQLREDKGWRPEDLAEQSGLSKRTIETAEKGGRVYLATIACVATALEVKNVGSLIVRSNHEPKPIRMPARVTITIDAEYDGFEGSGALHKLIGQLRAIIDDESLITVKKVEKGSVRVSLEMSPNDAKMLLMAAKLGALSGLPIQSIEVAIIDDVYKFTSGDEITKDELKEYAKALSGGDDTAEAKDLKEQFAELIAAFPDISS